MAIGREGSEQPRRAAAVLATGLFFLWGAASNLNDVLIAHFRELFRLDDLRSSLVRTAFYLGHFCFAIRAPLVIRRHGHRTAVVAGLVVFGSGALLFRPASMTLGCGVFLFALFVIASGLAFLETAANPMMAGRAGRKIDGRAAA